MKMTKIAVLCLMFGSSLSQAAGLDVSQIQNCLHQEQSLYSSQHPLKAQYLLQEVEGSVRDLILTTASHKEHIATVQEILKTSGSCAEARTRALSFAKAKDLAALPMLQALVDTKKSDMEELKLWDAEARKALKQASYIQAESTFQADRHPSLALFMASGETTSILEGSFEFAADSTMKTSLETLAGADGNADLLEARLSERIRAEADQKMEKALALSAGLLK
ncbi:hypothetical protein ACES2I_11950 [Bdellovibrio bacteriovorus]|uniref:hypothetical protein n=1 Tax=Bdellovibrio bacteriovorus TaxID=959 RepID=UPI0035A689B0